MTTYAVILICAYLLGGIPFGLLLAKAQGVDIRQVGSGNIGATNVVRALGPRFGFVTFGLDMLKGLIPAVATTLLVKKALGPLHPQTLSFLAGGMAVIGHAKSPFLGFKGGKGVSTALGAGLGSSPLAALGAFVIFAITLSTVRYMAVASIVGVWAVVAMPLLIPGYSPQLVPCFAGLAIIVTLLHTKNIERLRAGTEPKFRLKKSENEQKANSSPADVPVSEESGLK